MKEGEWGSSSSAQGYYGKGGPGGVDGKGTCGSLLKEVVEKWKS